MKVIKAIQFEEDDEANLKRLVEHCNMAASFFQSADPNDKKSRSGMDKVHWLLSGHFLTMEQMLEIEEALAYALDRVRQRKPHSLFPESLKQLYAMNLREAYETIRTSRMELL